MGKMQKVNVSKQHYGQTKFGNATASLDSVGVVGGQFTVSDMQNKPLAGVPVPAAVVGMTPIVKTGDRGSTTVTLAGSGNEVVIEGEYNEDATTIRLLEPEIVALTLNGIGIDVPVDPEV